MGPDFSNDLMTLAIFLSSLAIGISSRISTKVERLLWSSSERKERVIIDENSEREEDFQDMCKAQVRC